MSWLFGKKKHRDSPPDSPEEEPTPDEGFIFVEKKNQPIPNSDDGGSSLYPTLNNMTPYPPMPSAIPSVKQTSQEGQGNDLSQIPFKFCRELERNINEDSVIDQLRVEEIVSFINRIKVEDYGYEFSLERSIITEMKSQDEE